MNTRIGAGELRRMFAAAAVLLVGLFSFAAAHAANECEPQAVIQSSAQEVDEGVTVKLNGSPSKDEATYLWERVSGPDITFLPNATSDKPDFVAPQVAATTAVVIRLTVRGCSPVKTHSTTTTIIIRDTNAPANTPPTVTASANPPIALEGVTVALNGTAEDQQGGPFTYAWMQVANGAPTVTIQNANQLNASFVTPNLTGSSATLEFKLTVTDSGGLPGSANVLVNVQFSNDSPFAALSCPMQVNEGQAVTLSGTATDYEDDYNSVPLHYSWSQTKGPPNIDVASETTKSVSFVAPVLGTGDLGGIEFAFTVTDSQGAYSTADCGVYVNDITAPVFGPANDLVEEATSPAGAPVSFDLTATDNVEGDVSPSIVCSPTSGSTFALDKTTQVDCTVQDSNHNAAQISFDVTVLDRTKPVIDAHPDVAVEADGPAGSIVNYTAPGTFDVVDVDLVATCTPPSGSTFKLGSTDVLCDATDASGNAAAQTKFVVAIHDTTAPEIDTHANVVAEATKPQGADVQYASPAWHDTVDGDGVANCLPASGSTFALGTTTVHCRAQDAAGNKATGSFTVTVLDTTAPELELPADITREATGPSGAVVSFTATADDLVSGSVPVTSAPASGSTFGLAAAPAKATTTLVECSATDGAGNEATGKFNVTVQDTTAPALTLPAAPITVEATSAAGAIANWVVSSLDLVDGIIGPDCNHSPGTTLPLGDTTITCTATDKRGNKSDAQSFVVQVVDTTPPAIAPHPSILDVEATGPDGAPVTYESPKWHDLVDGDGVADCLPASGSTFALGTSTVHCRAADARGNKATSSFDVTVIDSRPPALSLPADITKEATGPGGATASFAPTASDIVSGSVPVACVPASGSTFGLAMAPAKAKTTPVTCSATDGAGNTATGSFNVTVQDTTAPALTVPSSFTREATSAAGAVASWSASSVDVVDGIIGPDCNHASGETFPLGETTVTCTATDTRGNTSAPKAFVVSVVDTTPPSITPHADVVVTATANSGAIATWTDPTATDLVDGSVAVTCVKASGSLFYAGDDNTITCSAKDVRGNAASTTFKVYVRYAFGGFFRPVDNLPTVNVVKAGQAIPVKFSLGGDQGLAIFAAGYPKSAAMACSGSVSDVIEETVTAGASTLQYDAGAGQYIYVWKSDKAWAGSCRQLQVKFADGTTQVANFSFTR
jgi:hypothetical protein